MPGALQKISRLSDLISFLDLRQVCSFSEEINLMTHLSRRIALLEQQLDHLNQRHHRLLDMQRLLQIGEAFRTLHRRLRENKAGATRLLAMLKEKGINEQTLEWTTEIRQLRNRAAHPDPQSKPDMTDLDPEIVRVYNTVIECLEEYQDTEKS